MSKNLRILFVGTAVPQLSDDLGLYHVAPKDRFWELLEYAHLTPTLLLSASDRNALIGAKATGALDERYKQFFFEKKENALLQLRIGITVLNRRLVVSKESDPAAEPSADDLQKFVRKVEKFLPKIVAFVTDGDLFQRCFRPIYPPATGQRGKQNFLIGDSEVWLIGSTSGRAKDSEAVEQVFDDLTDRLKELEKG